MFVSFPVDDVKRVGMVAIPDRHHASSPVVVTVTQPGSILRGRGLEVALDTRRYEFLSQVRSHYVPTLR